MEPIDIAEGLWLEGRAARLTWRSSFARVRATTSPDSCIISRESPLIATVMWNDRVWNGLECQVTAVFGDDSPTRKKLHDLRMVFVAPEEILSPREHRLWLKEQLLERFGPPAPPDGERDLLWNETLWHAGDVTVRYRCCNDRTGSHYVFLSVAVAAPPSNCQSDPAPEMRDNDSSP